MKLFISAITKFIFGIILVGAMLFLPAWTFSYPGAWLFLGVLFIPMLIVGTVLFLCGLALQVTLKDDTGVGSLARTKVIFESSSKVRCTAVRGNISKEAMPMKIKIKIKYRKAWLFIIGVAFLLTFLAFMAV